MPPKFLYLRHKISWIQYKFKQHLFASPNPLPQRGPKQVFHHPSINCFGNATALLLFIKTKILKFFEKKLTFCLPPSHLSNLSKLNCIRFVVGSLREKILNDMHNYCSAIFFRRKFLFPVPLEDFTHLECYLFTQLLRLKDFYMQRLCEELLDEFVVWGEVILKIYVVISFVDFVL